MKRVLAFLMFIPLLSFASIDITNIPLGGWAMTDTLLGVTNNNYAARGTVLQIVGTATNGYPWTNLTAINAFGVTDISTNTLPIGQVTTPGAIHTNGMSVAATFSNSVTIDCGVGGGVRLSNDYGGILTSEFNGNTWIKAKATTGSGQTSGLWLGRGSTNDAFADWRIYDAAGILTIDSDAQLGGNFNNYLTLSANSGGFNTFGQTTESTSKSSGCIVASGGIGIAKQLYCGSNGWFAGTLTATNGLYYLAQSNSVQGLNVLEPIHAWASVMLNNTNVVTVAADTYTNVSGYTLAYTNQFGADLVNGWITNLIAGFYRVAIHASVVAGNSDVTEGDFSVNGVKNDNISFVTIYDSPSRMKGVSANGIVFLPANSWCSFQIKTSGAGGYTIWRAQMTVGSP